MVRTLLVFCTFALVGTMSSAQTITIRCSREVDGKPLIPDSIVIVNDALNLRVVTTDVQFDLATVSVDDGLRADGDVETRIDQFDVQGRWITHRMGVLERAELRIDEVLGPVIEVPSMRTSAPTRGGKGGAVMSADDLTITTYRRAYHPETITIPIPQNSTEVSMALQLLPWWQRISGMNVQLLDSNAYVNYDGKSSYGQQLFGFMAGEQFTQSYDKCEGGWLVSGDTLTYQCTYPDGISYIGTKNLFIRLDTTAGTIDSLQYGSAITAGTFFFDDTLRMRGLQLMWEGSTDSLSAKISSPELCGSYLWAYSYEEVTISDGMGNTRDVTNYGRGMGVSSNCRASLTIWMKLEE